MLLPTSNAPLTAHRTTVTRLDDVFLTCPGLQVTVVEVATARGFTSGTRAFLADGILDVNEFVQDFHGIPFAVVSPVSGTS